VADNTESLRAADLIQAIKRAGIRFIVALPDRTTSEHLLKPLLEDPELRVVQICKEDEGVSICSGLYAAGQRALLLMQYTGLVVSVGTGAPPTQAIPFDAVHEAGIIGWLSHGLMEVILDGPNVAANQIAEVVLPEGSFYRFQAALTGPGYTADPAMDDWSETNLAALQAATQQLIQQEHATLVTVVQQLIG
jgi:hypothetical protein